MPRSIAPSDEMLDYINQWFYVDPVIGKVLYSQDHYFARAKANEPAGCLRADGRRIIYVKGRVVYASQIAAYFYHNKWPTQRVWVLGDDKDDLRPDNIFVGPQHPHSQRNKQVRQREDTQRRRREPSSHVTPAYASVTDQKLAEAYFHYERDRDDDFNQSCLRQWLKEKLNILLGGGAVIPGTDIVENRVHDTKFEAMSIAELEAAIELFS